MHTLAAREILGKRAPDWATAVSKHCDEYYWEESRGQETGTQWVWVSGSKAYNTHTDTTPRGVVEYLLPRLKTANVMEELQRDIKCKEVVIRRLNEDIDKANAIELALRAEIRNTNAAYAEVCKNYNTLSDLASAAGIAKAPTTVKNHDDRIDVLYTATSLTKPVHAAPATRAVTARNDDVLRADIEALKESLECAHENGDKLRLRVNALEDAITGAFSDKGKGQNAMAVEFEKAVVRAIHHMIKPGGILHRY